MTEKMLAEIEARANAATEGPWMRPSRGGEQAHDSVWTGLSAENELRVAVIENAYLHPGDASFIAHARTDVPALVACVRDLQKALDILGDEANGAPIGVA